jgi:hypothetical protein
MKFIIMHLSPRCVFLSFRSKYPPQHSVLKKPSVCVLPSKWETKFHTQNYSFVYFNLGKTKDFGLVVASILRI